MRYEFAYDAQGYVTTVTGGYGNVTSILRDGSGNTTAIMGPFAQQTLLGMHADGYLATITNPASESVGFTYTGLGSGLLATMTGAKMQVHAYEWDALGRRRPWDVRRATRSARFQQVSALERMPFQARSAHSRSMAQTACGA